MSYNNVKAYISFLNIFFQFVYNCRYRYRCFYEKQFFFFWNTIPDNFFYVDHGETIAILGLKQKVSYSYRAAKGTTLLKKIISFKIILIREY